jgi:hypothetical protein
MILVGILYIYVGKRTANKLSDLRKSLISEEELRQKFQECDQDQSGTITKRQFKTLTDHMGPDGAGVACRVHVINFRWLEWTFIGVSFQIFKSMKNEDKRLIHTPKIYIFK